MDGPVTRAQGALSATGEHARLMVKVARMYHEQGMRQAQIAEELHISQPRVSRLLKRASDEGVVRVSVSEPTGVFTDLESRLERRYGLTEAVVVDAGAAADVTSALGAAAATYLEATLIGGDRIGVSSWSASLLETARLLRRFSQPVATSVVQLVGGIGQSQVQVEASRLLTQLADATGGEPVFLPAPGLLGTAMARDALASDSSVTAVASHWDSLTTAIVGVGALEPSPLLRSSGNSLRPEDQEHLRARGAVGDVCLRFIDAHGDVVNSDVDDRVVGISPATLKSIPRRIGVAGGERKVESLRGVLRGGWLTVLITDAHTARIMVEGDA